MPQTPYDFRTSPEPSQYFPLTNYYSVRFYRVSLDTRYVAEPGSFKMRDTTPLRSKYVAEFSPFSVRDTIPSHSRYVAELGHFRMRRYYTALRYVADDSRNIRALQSALCLYPRLVFPEDPTPDETEARAGKALRAYFEFVNGHLEMGFKAIT
ncbi:hypothetical protein FQN50_006294 [Emmonsiellopsis sp. PD_5]|nr:hypothetical protein FQN50_006294 [Emmonsiellopsis sp. PD_5]